MGDADGRPGAGHVFDHDGLTKRDPHPLAQNPPERVSRTARGERHDHGDGMRWIILSERTNDTGEGASERRRKCDGSPRRIHLFPPGFLSPLVFRHDDTSSDNATSQEYCHDGQMICDIITVFRKQDFAEVRANSVDCP